MIERLIEGGMLAEAGRRLDLAQRKFGEDEALVGPSAGLARALEEAAAEEAGAP